MLALAGFGAILAGTGIGWGIGEAHAGPGSDYAADNAARICLTLDRFPSIAGITGIGQAIVNEGYLSFYDAGEAVGVSIAAVCPWHQPLMNRFIAMYAHNTTPVVKR